MENTLIFIKLFTHGFKLRGESTANYLAYWGHQYVFQNKKFD